MAKNVVMMGLGYIGLPTAALMAREGLQVLGVDISKRVVDTINKGEIHIYEPDLDVLIREVVKKGKLTASTEPSKSSTFLIAVPTPFKGNYEPDISFVESATRMIIPHLEAGNLFVVESTSPVGTTEKMAEIIYTERPELKGNIFIAYCPERVLPGQVIYELEHNDRVIGGINEQSTEKAIAFYRQFVRGELHPSTARTAEMCKLTENASRDVQIAFANELSMICDKAGINVWDLIRLSNKHPRVNILQPGCGVGGHCIAVDPWFIVHDFPAEAKMIKRAREINNHKPDWIVEKIKQSALTFKANEGRYPIIACMGLAFKPNIDDLRESPALEITNHLITDGLDVLAVEPNISEHKNFKLVEYRKAINDADFVVFLVAHTQFKSVDVMGKIVFDFCGVKS